MNSGLNLFLLILAVFGVLSALLSGVLAVRFYRVSVEWKQKSTTFRRVPSAYSPGEVSTALSGLSASGLSTSGLSLRSHASLLRKRGVGSFTYWPATNTFVVDAGTLNLLGLPPVDEGGVLSYEVFLGALDEESRPRVRDVIESCLVAKGGPSPVEVHFVPLRPDAPAKRIATLFQPVVSTNDEPTHVAGFAWDISYSIQKEHDLALTNERLELALAATKIGLVSLDTDASQVWLDITASRLFQIDEGETLSSSTPSKTHQISFGTWLSRVNSSDRTELLGGLTTRQHKHSFRRRLTLNDGITHLQLLAHQRPKAPDGIGWLGVVWNVTTEVEREQALTMAREQAQAANAAKSRFLASMSHEIRTPLNAILGFSQLLSRDFTLSETQREQLHTVNQSGRNLLGILNDVLDMAKVETGSVALAEEPVDLAGALFEIRKLYWPQATAKGLRLELTVAPDFPSLLVFDVNRFRQILNHLLVNSLQYTESGKISLVVSAESMFEHKFRVSVRLTNTGPGIPRAAQESIFRPFERGSEAVESGTGLGLSISRDLARLLKGDLTVESDGVLGATFVLTFLAGAARQNERFSVPPRAMWLAADNPKVTVLVVDDRESNRGLLSAMLSKVGLSVLVAKSGQHAIELLKSSTPNVALLDLKMPDLSGFEVAQRVKDDPKSAHIPLIAVSASAQDFASEPDARLFADFAYKPVNMDEIIGLISKHAHVRFAYEASSEETEDQSKDIALTLAELSLPNRPQLCDALECLDYNRFAALLDQSPELPLAAREHLRGLASRFDNETLLTLLRLP